MTFTKTVLLAVILLAPPGVAAAIGKSQRYPRRFAEVVPGGLYRGGFPTARHIHNLLNDKGIRTVVSLTDLKNEPKYAEEAAVAQAAGLRLLRFPMKGDGCGEFDDLDRAADAIGDQANWPLFFHCNAGKQRSNAVLAAYRLRKCRWTIEQALKELEDKYDLDRAAEKALVDHLQEYARRIRPAAGNLRIRPAQ